MTPFEDLATTISNLLRPWIPISRSIAKVASGAVSNLTEEDLTSMFSWPDDPVKAALDRQQDHRDMACRRAEEGVMSPDEFKPTD